MAKSNYAKKTHRVPSRTTPPREVPDNKRPVREPGSPGGNRPRGIQPGWTPVRGSGVIYHTHS